MDDNTYNNSQQLSDVQQVININPYAIAPTGELRSLVEQYAQFAFLRDRNASENELAPYSRFVMALNCDYLGIPALMGKPLILKKRQLKHIETKHGGTVEELALLSKALQDNLLAYQYPIDDTRYVFVLSQVDEIGRRYIAALDASVDANINPVQRNKPNRDEDDSDGIKP